MRLLCAILVIVGVVAAGTAHAQSPEDLPRLRSERDDLTEMVETLEAQVLELTTSIDELSTTIVDHESAVAELADQIAANAVARAEPARLRRSLAVATYIAGDPRATSIIDELMQGTSQLEPATERATYQAIVDHAFDTLADLDGSITEARKEADDLREELTDAQAGIDETRTQLETAVTEREVKTAELVAVAAEIARLELLTSRFTLTGLPTASNPSRPALAVKIDNVSRARPQAGINQADIVIEEKVEAGLTRLIAVFNSSAPSVVGPVRSARTSDVHILANLNQPLLAYSGANQGVLNAIANSTLADVGINERGGAYFRESSRSAPHNLFTRPGELWASAPDNAGLAPPILTFREGPLPTDAVPAGQVSFDFGSTDGSYSWSADSGGWTRTQDGSTHVDASGVAARPANVIVQFTNYRPSPAAAQSPEAIVVGSGDVWVFTEGHIIVGTWERSSAEARTIYRDSTGTEIGLTAGRTWIELVESGHANWS
ncbi:MAG: DUF3048 domain-containing protein [Actinomycetia bacterium]|nr:DUF3048 domain-containing protein [Actinomycetes bacterium]MCP3910168.1 DUF3048 domain-containing protein [Actinomycetes bacterium]